MFCLDCGKEIGNIAKNRICPYCGFSQYEPPRTNIKTDKQQKFKQEKGLSEEEILALGLYPKDEGYKMSLILRILGKNC